MHIAEVAKPTPKEHEVLIKICAVSINPQDWDLLVGTPFVNRLATGLRKPKKRILGSDIAGRVEAVGKAVTRFKPGDEVYGDISGRWGGFAEYVCARESSLALKSPAMTFEEAAAIPQAAMLAVQGLRDRGEIKPGQKVLINGAGGGVGTFGVQLAKLYAGVEVTGVDSAGKLDMMRAMGFDHVIDYKKVDFTKTGQQYDLILDAKTNRSPFAYARALRPNGIYATVGGATPRLLQALLLGPLVAMISKKHIRIVVLKANKDLAYMNELFEAGKVKPVLDRPYTLAEVPEAMRYAGAEHHQGKVVITVEQGDKA
jgi:NADPH:quinone reductase-like Zn-dependent oxidoreductase